MAAAKAAPVRASGRRTRRSVSHNIHGISVHTLACGYTSQVAIHRLKPKTTPARSDPPWRRPIARARRKVPNAATKSFSAVVNASDS